MGSERSAACTCPDFTGPVDTRHVCPVHGPLYADDQDAANDRSAATPVPRKLVREQARKRHYKDALQRIVDMPINEEESAAFHFAEVRRIAREALKDV